MKSWMLEEFHFDERSNTINDAVVATMPGIDFPHDLETGTGHLLYEKALGDPMAATIPGLKKNFTIEYEHPEKV